jgi:hypothetical protein
MAMIVGDKIIIRDRRHGVKHLAILQFKDIKKLMGKK